jgi:hypothetical protein
MSQVDSLSVDEKPAEKEVTDNTSEEDDNSGKKEHKRVSDFKAYGGISVSNILLSDGPLESAYATGFLLGVAYRKGRFAYWEIGANYNNSVVSIEGVNALEENMNIRQVELPLSAGLNLLSATRRVVGVRLFGGVVPGYIVNVSNNPFNLEVDDFDQFQLGGRAGVGVDVLFLFLEVGYQYGFLDMLKERGSNLSQIDFRLGVRF